MGQLSRIHCVEAGHPVPDENSFKGTQEVLSMVKDLTEEDMVLFLVSGGGSALFENPESQRKNYRISQSSCLPVGLTS